MQVELFAAKRCYALFKKTNECAKKEKEEKKKKKK